MPIARPLTLSCALLLLACSEKPAEPVPSGPVKLPTAVPANPPAAAQPAAPGAQPAAAPAAPAAAAPAPDEEACARVIVVAFDGAQPPTEGVTRDKAAAQARAGELLTKVQGGADFVALARSDSDAPTSAARDGIVGTYKRNDWPVMHLPVSDAVYKLKVGEVAPEVVATTYGFVVLQRCPVEKASSRHILIRYKDAKRAPETITRSKAAAKKLAGDLLEQLRKGADFAELAKTKSEDGSAVRGGEVGLQPRGLFAPAYEKALFALKPGERSGVVETDMGFHIIERLPD